MDRCGLAVSVLCLFCFTCYQFFYKDWYKGKRRSKKICLQGYSQFWLHPAQFGLVHADNFCRLAQGMWTGVLMTGQVMLQRMVEEGKDFLRQLLSLWCSSLVLILRAAINQSRFLLVVGCFCLQKKIFTSSRYLFSFSRRISCGFIAPLYEGTIHGITDDGFREATIETATKIGGLLNKCKEKH